MKHKIKIDHRQNTRKCQSEPFLYTLIYHLMFVFHFSTYCMSNRAHHQQPQKKGSTRKTKDIYIRSSVLPRAKWQTSLFYPRSSRRVCVLGCNVEIFFVSAFRNTSECTSRGRHPAPKNPECSTVPLVWRPSQSVASWRDTPEHTQVRGLWYRGCHQYNHNFFLDNTAQSDNQHKCVLHLWGLGSMYLQCFHS